MSANHESHPGNQNMKLPPLSIEEKRQVLYSSLLRYTAEVVPLRERALDRVVLGALIGSTEEEPYRVGKIQENLHFGSNAPEIRNDAIQGTLRRLETLDKVRHTLLRKNHAYYLAPQAEEDVREVIGSAEPLFNTVLGKILRDTDHLFNYETGAAVCRKFFFECFARFGQIIAKNVTGNISHETLMRS